MKKKKILVACSFCFLLGIGTTFLTEEENVTDLVLANVEALSVKDTGLLYEKHIHDCPDPVEYKKSVSCTPGGREDCLPSDC